MHNLFPNLSRRWVRRLDVPLVTTLHNFRSDTWVARTPALYAEVTGRAPTP